MTNTDNEWVFELPTRIYRIIKAITTEDIGAILASPKYITIDETVDFTTFPTIRIGAINPIEIGQTLDGIAINGVTLTEQVEVYVNTSTTDARAIANIIVSAFKLLAFEVVAFPEVRTQDGVHIAVMRFRRVYGANDTI